MSAHPSHPVVQTTLRRRVVMGGLYFRALAVEFRWTLFVLGALVIFAAALHWLTPARSLDGQQISIGDSLYAAWMALLAQPQFAHCPWYLKLVYAFYPVMGFILIGEGIVRLALLMMSRRHGEKEWMRVAASTYRDHVILCGLGHLGFRVLQQLVASDIPVVAMERSGNNLFLAEAKALRVPVLARDMKEDQALLDAGVERAAAILICSNDDMANLEVAIDSRRMNPKIRVVMRLFDQQLAAKIGGALTIDAAFSSSALAAPVVAAMAFQTRVLATVMIAGEPHVTAELTLEAHCPLDGRTIGEVETGYDTRVLARTSAGAAAQARPSADQILRAGDTLVLHAAAHQLPTLAAAGRRGNATA